MNEQGCAPCLGPGTPGLGLPQPSLPRGWFHGTSQGKALQGGLAASREERAQEPGLMPTHQVTEGASLALAHAQLGWLQPVRTGNLHRSLPGLCPGQASSLSHRAGGTGPCPLYA